MRWLRPVVLAGTVGVMALQAHAIQPKNKSITPAFQVTARGMQLERSGGVPVSGVVLYKTTHDTITARPLNEVGPNVRCNQDPFGTRQNEITAAANGFNTDILITGSNDYRNGDASGGFYKSTDGAGTFSDAIVTRGPSGVYDAAGDPVVGIDQNGRMFCWYIAFDRDPGVDNGIYCQTSDDNGDTWSDPVPVVEHIGDPNPDFEDKPYATIDNVPGSPYANNAYVTWTKFLTSGGSQIYFAKSTDGGASYGTPIPISGSLNTQFSCPTVGPNGEIYVVWYTYGSHTIRIDYSTDGGTTWHLDHEVVPFDDSFPNNPCGTWRVVSYPVVGCDVSGGPRNGWIYISYVDNSTGEPDVMFTRSVDAGVTWTPPVHVEDDVTNHWQWFHWMTVDPETGNIGISWLDRREDPSGCEYRTYASVSTDGGSTWAPNFPVADVASDPSASNFIGDYGGNTFRSNGFYAGWVDLRNDGGDVYAAWYNAGPPAPEHLTVYLAGSDLSFRWNSVNAAAYHVLSSDSPDGPFETLVGATPDTTLTTPVDPIPTMKFYTVVAVSE